MVLPPPPPLLPPPIVGILSKDIRSCRLKNRRVESTMSGALCSMNYVYVYMFGLMMVISMMVMC